MAAVTLTPGRVMVVNIDGPPVSVEVDGVSHFSVGCPGSQTVWIPLLKVVPREVRVIDARTRVVLRRMTVARDIEFVIRRDGVLWGDPGGSGGPAPINGCA